VRLDEHQVHTFHIPVLGLAFSIDTPIRVARFGISSVISIVDDVLIEHMRKHHSKLACESYIPISSKEADHRARRITEYLNLLHRIVQKQIAQIKVSAFEKGNDIVKYFEMLAGRSPLKLLYDRMVQTREPELRIMLQTELRKNIHAGAIDVNIMTKVNRTNFGSGGEELPPEYSDALSALRGFVRSDLNSSVVLSAGLNQRLFTFIGQCPEFLPDPDGNRSKKIILKVSDYRSAHIQGKILAKKGVWISEFRIESGLNCGGHAFATHGELLGPILEEFKNNRKTLADELFSYYQNALLERGRTIHGEPPEFRITVQGGIGTSKEDTFLMNQYGVDGTGWGSPFLLVPEATNLDDETRKRLANAGREDFYISDASPLGIPFNNFHGSTSEERIQERINANRPGSPCTKKFLCSNTEFTATPICTASRQYQDLKIKQLKSLEVSTGELEKGIRELTAKACLCEDLAATAFINSDTEPADPHPAVAICPGPNLAYFSKIVSLAEMVGHIYGRSASLTSPDRPHMFLNELRMYIDYFKIEIQKRLDSIAVKDRSYLDTFNENLQAGIAYYKSIIPKLIEETEHYREAMWAELYALEAELAGIALPVPITG
jgi:hypothetical protein